MKLAFDNLLAGVDAGAVQEQFTELLAGPHVRIERIVSTGQATAPGVWLDQDWDEFVLLVAGSAGLLVEGEAIARTLKPGDHVAIPAHVRHRVEWTSSSEPTIWLAVHCRPAE